MKLQLIRLFVQKIVHANNNGTANLHISSYLCKGSTCDRWIPFSKGQLCFHNYDLVQDCNYSSANALKLLPSCTKPSISI